MILNKLWMDILGCILVRIIIDILFNKIIVLDEYISYFEML